jgi:hypothetical protein
MVGHRSPNSNVRGDELLPRAASFEHCAGTGRRQLVSRVEHTVEQQAAATGEPSGNTCLRWRVN